MCPAASSRWCPTPEQLMILEELYRSGIRTPNAPQIQRITAHLSLYGKIEGKNVFYWFQNHKARDRQKLRRKLIKQLQHQQLVFHQNHQNQPNLSLLNYFDPPPPPPPPPTSALHQLGLHTTPLIPPPQGGGVEGGAAAAQMMHHYTWKVENYPQRDHQEHHHRQIDHDGPMMMMRLHHQHQHQHQQTSHDWMMMMEMGPAAADPYASSSPACCNTRTTLKTLELFPITSTDLKEECKNNNNNNNNNNNSSNYLDDHHHQLHCTAP